MGKKVFAIKIVFALLFFILVSYYYFVTSPKHLPADNTPIAGMSFWLASVNIYLETGKILMAPEAWRHFDNIDRTLIHFSSKGSIQTLIPLEEALGSDDQGYPFILSILGKIFGISGMTYDWFVKFNYFYLIFLGFLASIFLFLSFGSFFICMVFYSLYLFIVHIYDGWVDYHWMMGALVIFYASFLIYMLKQREKFNYIWLFPYLAIAGWGDVIRMGDGIVGILLLLFCLVLLKFQDIKKLSYRSIPKLSLKFASKHYLPIILLIFIYILPEIILDMMRNERDKRYFDGRHSSLPTHHTLWHHAFIGLGYVQNDYGIKYDERWLETFLKQAAPGIRDYSREEDIFLRNLYLSYVIHSPSLLTNNLAVKFIAVNTQIADWFGRVLPKTVLFKGLSTYSFYIVLVILFLISGKSRSPLSKGRGFLAQNKVDRSVFWLLLASFLLTITPALIVAPNFSKGVQASVFMTTFYLTILLFERLKNWLKT